MNQFFTLLLTYTSPLHKLPRGMSNKHINTQHGLTTMNLTRPKSKLRKRANKAKARVRREEWKKSLVSSSMQG